MEPKSKRNSAVVRISQLPDDILVHILSYIPTFDSVQTMVLSKRWKNLWTFVPALDFDQQEYSKRRHGDDRAWYTIDEFNKFVDGALSLHNPSTIRKFRLHFVRNVGLRDEDFPRISHWIRRAMRHEVFELDISLFPFQLDKIDLKLPPTVVLCKTLEVLKVESNCIAYPRTSPGCFPSLKLADITTEDVDNSSLTELFCNCPVLEELRIQANFYQNDVEISISAPELHTLRTSVLNVDEEIREVKGISIDAPKLKNFFFSGNLTRCIFLNAKPLVKANIEEDFVYQDLNPELLKRATALFAGVSSVEYLNLCGRNYMACSLPVFSNLRQLKLKLFLCPYLEYLMELLKRSPKLEDLVLDINVRSWYDQEYVEGYEPFKPPEIVPICIVSQLKTVSITHITGHDELLDLVEYILKYGRVLKKISLSTSGELLFQSRHMTEEKFKRQILKYQKSSNTCEVELKFEMEGIGSTSCSDCGSILFYSERII